MHASTPQGLMDGMLCVQPVQMRSVGWCGMAAGYGCWVCVLGMCVLFVGMLCVGIPDQSICTLVVHTIKQASTCTHIHTSKQATQPDTPTQPDTCSMEEHVWHQLAGMQHIHAGRDGLDL